VVAAVNKIEHRSSSGKAAKADPAASGKGDAVASARSEPETAGKDEPVAVSKEDAGTVSKAKSEATANAEGAPAGSPAGSPDGGNEPVAAAKVLPGTDKPEQPATGAPSPMAAAPIPPPPPVKVVPNPPVWVAMPPPFLLVQGTGSFQATYGPAAGASVARWHVQIASNESFHEPRIDTTVDGKVTVVDAKDLPPGKWLVRVSAIDEDHIEGAFLPSGIVQIAKAEITPGPGTVRVTLTSPGAKVACGIDDEQLVPRETPFEVQARSERKLRCAPADALTRTADLTIEPPKITVSAHLSLSGPESGVFEVTVHDESGHNLPGLQLMAHPSAPLKVGTFRESEGRYRADASWPPNTPRLVTEFADSQDLVGVKFSVKLRQASSDSGP
jgi:hypothetical protein